MRYNPRNVDIWTVLIRASDAVVANLWELLSVDERNRAERYRFPELSRNYVLSRGSLRLLLSSYCCCDPTQIRFLYGPRGKPSLSDGKPLQFNASHSGDLLVIGVTDGVELGIDVERIRPVRDLGDIACRFFCREEAMELMSLPREEQAVAFFRCWTRKEAYIKAVGDGLAIDLNSFQVTIREDEAARFLHIGREPSAAAGWRLHHLDPGMGFVGALAYRGAASPIAVRSMVTPEELVLASNGSYGQCFTSSH